MNTILVNCSKEKAEVSDENGRFLCRVANGIKIDVGDEISVEQIAVNSIGVGSNIIEIPSQQLNYNYSTNRFALKTAFYIHHNYEFTCAMPLTITTGGGDMGNIQLGINTAPFRQGYGYFNGTPTDIRFQLVCPRWEAPDIIAKQSGRRYYLLDYVEGSNVSGSKYPGDSWWDFIEAEVPIEVDIGYDNPGNLAGKITEDLKSIDLHSAASLINTRANPPIPPPPIETENDSNSVDNIDNKNTQASISSTNGIIQTRPVNFTNGSFANPERLYSGIATQNPYLWKYGTRLINAAKPTILSPELGRKVIQPITNLENQQQVPDQRQVYNLYDLETNATGTQNIWNDGYVIPLNLEWNAGNIEMLQKFIYSQSTYQAGGGFSNSDEYVKQTPGVQSKMRWSLRSGRTNDYLIPTSVDNIQQGLWSPASWNAAAVPIPTLAAPLPAGATPPPNTNIESLNTYFQQDLWDKRYLGKSRLYGNYTPAISVNTDRPYKTSLGDADAPDIVVSGVGNLRPYEVAKFFNMNITAVKIGGKDEGIATSLQTTTTTTIVPAVPAVPAVPDSFDLQNSEISNDGAVSLVSDFDVANNVIPLTLNGGAKQFTDDGGTPNNYSTSHFRHITFDAGAGNAVWVNFKTYAFEASSFSHYDRLYITASNSTSDLNSSSGLLNDTKSPTLSPKLYQSASTGVSSGLGNSYVASNGGYGTGGGWVVPTESGDDGTNDMKGNNNSSWLNTWYKINTRYVRFYFKSDGSSTDTGWEILVAPEIFTAGSPEIPEIPSTTTTTTTTALLPTDVGDVADEYVIGLVMNSKELPVPTAPAVPIRAGNYMLVDLGMTQMNNSCVQLLNPNTQVVVADLTAANPAVYDPAVSVEPADWIDDIQVGSPNALFLFEPGRGRFGFQDLHWKKYTGNGYLATSTNPNGQPNPSGSVAVNEFNKTINHFLNPANKDKTALTKYIPYFEFTGAVSGIGLQDVGLYPTSHNNILNSPPITYLKTLTKSQRDAAYKGSLLDRFGFEYNYLFNEFGFSECMFNSKYYSNGIPSAYPQFYPSPLTTNSLIDTAMALNFDYNADGNPNFSLNFLNGFPNRNSSSESAIIYATNLPQKLVFPFWLIHSDIIGGIEFHSENAGSTSNIVAICNRAYTSGDFAFSFATDYTFTATQEYVISGINTQILNPDLTPADVNDRTSIVYKIQKRIPMFEAPKVLPDKKKPDDFTDKAKKDRARNDDTAMPSVFSLT